MIISSAFGSFLNKNLNPPKKTNADKIAKDIKWVIFPENRFIRHWDELILICLYGNLFIIPFQIGVSFNYYLNISTSWLVIQVLVNSLFFIDNFLYFFRAFRSKDGILVINLQTIRRHYLLTFCAPCFISTLPSNLLVYYLGKKELEKHKLVLVVLLQLAKCLRFIRLPHLLSVSEFTEAVKKKYDSKILELLKHARNVLLLAHFYACIWSFVAFCEAGGTFDEPAILTKPNWLGFWYDRNYIKGSINPIGSSNVLARYALSLSWAVQTVTTVGYGNINAFTQLEYWVISIMMLFSGFFWAHIIGGLVGVTNGMREKEANEGARMDEARELISDFHAKDNYKKMWSDKIKTYIQIQHIRSNKPASMIHLYQAYPVLKSLTPEMQCASSYLLMNKYLESVTYLSSKFLSMEEQSKLAFQCTFVDFAAGENASPRLGVDHLGAGLFIMKRGIAIHPGVVGRSANFILAGMSFGNGEVLLEDNLCPHRNLHFITFSKVIFVPRNAILEVLRLNKRAWKECGRWRYLASLMISLRVAHLERHSQFAV